MQVDIRYRATPGRPVWTARQRQRQRQGRGADRLLDRAGPMTAKAGDERRCARGRSHRPRRPSGGSVHEDPARGLARGGARPGQFPAWAPRFDSSRLPSCRSWGTAGKRPARVEAVGWLADIAPDHSITSSARSSMLGATVSPMADAVFKLTINSKAVAC
jgi:hypothetical protein